MGLLALGVDDGPGYFVVVVGGRCRRVEVRRDRANFMYITAETGAMSSAYIPDAVTALGFLISIGTFKLQRGSLIKSCSMTLQMWPRFSPSWFLIRFGVPYVRTLAGWKEMTWMPWASQIRYEYSISSSFVAVAE